jgi:hypothetical protein
MGDIFIPLPTTIYPGILHSESREFLSPDGAFFEGLATPISEHSSLPREFPSHCRLVEQGEDAKTCEMFVATPKGPTPIRSLGDLLDRLSGISTDAPFDIAGQPPSSRFCRRC